MSSHPQTAAGVSKPLRRCSHYTSYHLVKYSEVIHLEVGGVAFHSGYREESLGHQ